MNSKISPENSLELNDQNEILTLIDLLVLRVECLNNETKKKKHKDTLPTVTEVDHNLIEYLYYLFKKFTEEDSDLPSPSTNLIDKNKFVHVCQTLVRNGSFELTSLSPDQSMSDSTLTDQTLTSETIPPSSTIDEQDTWLLIDLEQIQSTPPEILVSLSSLTFGINISHFLLVSFTYIDIR